MKLEEVMNRLAQLGNENTKKTFMRHGAREPLFGVKITELKKIQKQIKTDHDLSKELYKTGNSDAMYLAGLIADPSKMTKTDLNNWAKKAYWYLISEYTISSVTSRSEHANKIALQWIDSPKENIASAGWATLSAILLFKSENNLELSVIKNLLERIRHNIHTSPNRVRYTMNGFVITAGGYIPSITKKALSIANEVGKVNVEMGETACKVPHAAKYINKIVDRRRLVK